MAGQVKTFVLVVGAAGAGKSTFINSKIGRAVCTVSTQRNKDGTLQTNSHEEGDFVYIDTVGADSKNAVSSVVATRQELLKHQRIDALSIVVVCRYDTDRFTTWSENAIKTVNALVKSNRPDKKVVLICYWRGVRPAHILATTAHRELDEEFGNCFQIQHCDGTDLVSDQYLKDNTNQIKKDKIRQQEGTKAISGEGLSTWKSERMISNNQFSSLFEQVVTLSVASPSLYDGHAFAGDAQYKADLCAYARDALGKSINEIEPFIKHCVAGTVQAAIIDSLQHMIDPKHLSNCGDVLNSEDTKATLLEAMYSYCAETDNGFKPYRFKRLIFKTLVVMKAKA